MMEQTASHTQCQHHMISTNENVTSKSLVFPLLLWCVESCQDLKSSLKPSEKKVVDNYESGNPANTVTL